MSFDCDTLKQLVTSLALVRECDVVGNGMLRMATPFRYPDGAYIDLFLGQTDNVFAPFRLTDLGNTTAYLLDLQLKPWATQRRKRIIDDISKSLGIDREGAELVVPLTEDKLKDHLPDHMVRLAQACIRMADLSFTQRLRTVPEFREDLEEYISSVGVAVEPQLALPGRFGKDVPIDFRTRGRRVQSLILTLSTQNSAAAHPLANEVFRKWYDLESYRSEYQLLTIYDSSNDVFRPDDIERLGEKSTVLAFPAQEEMISEAIAA